MHNTLVIIGSSLDPHVDSVLNMLEMEVCFLDPYLMPKCSIIYDRKEIKIEDRTFSFNESIGFWWRWKGPFQKISPVSNNTLENLDRKSFFEENWWRFTYSLPFLMENAVSTNPFQTKSISNNKAIQLGIAIEIGLKTPQSFITNSIGTLDILQEDKVLLKRLADKQYLAANTHSARKVQKEDLCERREEFAFHPSIIQNYVPKDFEARIYVINSTTIGVHIDSQKKDVSIVDWRPNQFDVSMFSPIRVPRDIKSLLQEFMKRFDLHFGCFDFIVTPEGDWIFLECNPDGQWLFVDEISASNVTAAMANHLNNFCS